MRDLRYTLTTDGSSDRSLIPILSWLLRAQNVVNAIQPTWADLRRLRRPPRTLAERIAKSLDLYPCDLLFVHRDAEREPRPSRVAEIKRAVRLALQTVSVPPRVCVIPVRMLEAWLLFDEQAVRRAAGNPNGAERIALPALDRLEDLPDPKNELYALLREASGLHGRRLKRFAADQASVRVSQFTADFSLLRGLPAFRAMESELHQVVRSEGWDCP